MGKTSKDTLISAVVLAATTFEDYAAQHYNKNTEEGNKKGNANRILAVKMRDALREAALRG